MVVLRLRIITRPHGCLTRDLLIVRAIYIVMQRDLDLGKTQQQNRSFQNEPSTATARQPMDDLQVSNESVIIGRTIHVYK